MVFSSAVFLFMFLPIVFLGNLIIKKELSNYFLFISSLVFYAWGEPYLVFLMGASVVINWSIGIVLSKTQGVVRRVLLILGITCNLGMLSYYKYEVLFADIINGFLRKEVIPVLGIPLPIGISFFTFQAISYIVDIYRNDTKPSKNLVNVGLYISFFPQLIAGPIVKYRDINTQIEQRSINWICVSDGFKRFIYGLGKKVLIANILGECVDAIYAYDIATIDTRTAWIGALAYSFQIYYDFSGYSDMAIGLGKMFGFRILENFDYPYLSRSVSEFWRRWHISLGTWFREYVYIPLGGSKNGYFHTLINLAVVFFLTGLWHGADISFILWGMFHGFFTIVEKVGLKKILDKFRVLSVVYTFLVVNIGWVLFRADSISVGLHFIANMLIPTKKTTIRIDPRFYLDNRTIFVFVCAVLGMGLVRTFVPDRVKNAWKNSVVEAMYCVCIFVLCVVSVASDTYNPFIYYQF